MYVTPHLVSITHWIAPPPPVSEHRTPHFSQRLHTSHVLTHSIAPSSLRYLSTQRALYTHLVIATFESRYDFNQTTKRILGHEGLQESLNYSSVFIGKNASLPRFGLLLV